MYAELTNKNVGDFLRNRKMVLKNTNHSYCYIKKFFFKRKLHKKVG